MEKKPTLRENASINDCQRLAIESGAHDKATFELVGPAGRIKASWLDAYFGFVQLDGEEGFCMARNFDVPYVHCENFAVPESAA